MNSELLSIVEDTRVGGFGIYFSGILIISIIVIIVYIIFKIKNKEYEKLIFIGIPFIITILLIFFFGESWWARYSPQTYFIVLMALFILLTSQNKKLYALASILLLLCAFNSALIFRQMVKTKIPVSGQTRMNLEKLENQTITLKKGGFTGVQFNLIDHNIKFKTKEKVKNETPLYIGRNYYESKENV